MKPTSSLRRLFFAFAAIFSISVLQPLSLSTNAAPSAPVEQWGVYEIVLKGPSNGNPFKDVRLDATFTNGMLTKHVPGFYDGGGVYRIRFMPETPGNWSYETTSNRWPLTGKTGAFTATPANAKSGNHGPVRVANTYHFTYADGTPFKPVGTTCYSWTQRTKAMQEQTVKTLATAPFNKVRMGVPLQAHGVKYDGAYPTLFPFAGKFPHDFDFTRFNPEFFRNFEKRILQLQKLGIEADIILFHPYDDDEEWGLETMDRETDEMYLRYIVARFSAYRNVWWAIGNEFDFLRTKTMEDWDNYFQLIQKADPYDHLRSIHNGKILYDHNKPWVTHVSMQNAMAAEEPGRATLYRDVYRKPIVYDELKYEGDHNLRWAQLTGEEMTQHFWACTVAGTYGGHSEFFADDREVVWLGNGGTLKGTSPARLGFLKKIIDEAPSTGIDPIDQWQDPRIAGKAGEYYLVYFGYEKPTSWKMAFYRNGLTDDMQFKCDIIDTWNMTITPVEGIFTTKKLDRYTFVDKDGREINLPGKQFMALRFRYVGGAKPGVTVKAGVEPDPNLQ